MKMNILEKYIENSIIEYYEISIFKLLERIAVYLIQNSIDFSSTVLTIKKYLSGITCILTSEVGKTIFEEKHPFFPSLKDLITETTEKVDTASETRSPLAIDLDGDGVETISVDNGVCFNDTRTKYNYRFTKIYTYFLLNFIAQKTFIAALYFNRDFFIASAKR